MKKAILLSLLLTIPMISIPKNGAPVSKDSLATLVIASYNVTHAKKNNWDKRKAGVISVIKGLNADIYGLQEAIKANDQFSLIEQTLPMHNVVGEPRSSGTWSLWHNALLKSGLAQDEYCPIFYNKDKFKLLETKTVGINGNNWIPNLLPRIYTMAHLQDIATGKDFYVYNTHLDHKSEQSRTEQAQLISKDILKESNGKPVILLGDFNTTFDKGIQKVLATNKFVHAKSVAKKREGDDVTHEKGKGELKKLIECDHILIEPQSDFSVGLYKTSDTMSDQTSDHNPVSMTFSLK